MEKTFGEYTFREGDKVMQIKNNYDIMFKKDNVEQKELQILENYIKLEWKIDNSITNVSGNLQVQIEAIKDDIIWKTYPATFIIASGL